MADHVIIPKCRLCKTTPMIIVADDCCCTEQSCPLHMIPMSGEQWQTLMHVVVPMVPMVPTVSNEMKSKFIGEFEWQEDASYYDDDERCYVEYRATRTVPWDLCKTIFKQMAAHWIAAAPSPEPVQPDKTGAHEPALTALHQHLIGWAASTPACAEDQQKGASIYNWRRRFAQYVFEYMQGREKQQPVQPLLSDEQMETEYKYATCPAGCGCLWRDNRDGTMSLAGRNSHSCDACEPMAWGELTQLGAHQQPAQPIPTGERLPNESDADCEGQVFVWMSGCKGKAWLMTHWLNAKHGDYWLPTGLTRPEAPTPEQPCDWREDEDGYWNTGCGDFFTIIDGGPEENGMKFCHSCGKHLKEISYACPEAGNGLEGGE